jgi:hypothetical protein
MLETRVCFAANTQTRCCHNLLVLLQMLLQFYTCLRKVLQTLASHVAQVFLLLLGFARTKEDLCTHLFLLHMDVQNVATMFARFTILPIKNGAMML